MSDEVNLTEIFVGILKSQSTSNTLLVEIRDDMRRLVGVMTDIRDRQVAAVERKMQGHTASAGGSKSAGETPTSIDKAKPGDEVLFESGYVTRVESKTGKPPKSTPYFAISLNNQLFCNIFDEKEMRLLSSAQKNNCPVKLGYTMRDRFRNLVSIHLDAPTPAAAGAATDTKTQDGKEPAPF